jgi:hypothetical protein
MTRSLPLKPSLLREELQRTSAQGGAVQEAEPQRELRLVAPDLLDDALGVLAADVDLGRIAERERLRERVVDHGVDEYDAEDDAGISRCRDGSSGPAA